jgi:hypothetical protein
MLLHAPEDWPQPVVAAVAMVLLAALDLAGSFAAKEAVQRGSIGMAAFGAALFLVLFWVYLSSLEVAELSAVTFGWIVLLQVGVVLLDRYRYHVMPTPGAWLAIAVLLAAQSYLVLAPGVLRQPTASVEPATSTGSMQSAECLDEGVETVHHHLAELHGSERADRDGSDQQSLTNGLVSGVGHVCLQPIDDPTATAITQA